MDIVRSAKIKIILPTLRYIMVTLWKQKDTSMLPIGLRCWLYEKLIPIYESLSSSEQTIN